jgi:hypothetical protein
VSIADLRIILIDEGHESAPEQLSDPTLSHHLEFSVLAAQKLNADGDGLRDLIAEASEA